MLFIPFFIKSPIFLEIKQAEKTERLLDIFIRCFAQKQQFQKI